MVSPGRVNLSHPEYSAGKLNLLTVARRIPKSRSLHSSRLLVLGIVNAFSSNLFNSDLLLHFLLLYTLIWSNFYDENLIYCFICYCTLP
jgi:hypothetical protein